MLEHSIMWAKDTESSIVMNSDSFLRLEKDFRGNHCIVVQESIPGWLVWDELYIYNLRIR